MKKSNTILNCLAIGFVLFIIHFSVFVVVGLVNALSTAAAGLCLILFGWLLYLADSHILHIEADSGYFKKTFGVSEKALLLITIIAVLSALLLAFFVHQDFEYIGHIRRY